MKIIREYGLFTIEEDDYFMPAELNPVKKRGGKAEKIVPQDAVSKQENGEKSKKTSNSPAATVSPKPSAAGGQQPPLPPQTSFTVPNHALHRPRSVSLGELRCVISDAKVTEN